MIRVIQLTGCINGVRNGILRQAAGVTWRILQWMMAQWHKYSVGQNRSDVCKHLERGPQLVVAALEGDSCLNLS